MLFAHSSRDVRAAAAFDWQSSRVLPLEIHRNTTVGALLADPRTAPVLEPMLRVEEDQQESEVSREAITEEMIRQMLVNSPLRSLQRRKGLTQAQLQELIGQLQRAVDEPSV